MPAVLTASGLRARVTRIVSRHAFIAPLWSRGIATAIVSAAVSGVGSVGGLTLVEATVLALPFDSTSSRRLRPRGSRVGRDADLRVARRLRAFTEPDSHLHTVSSTSDCRRAAVARHASGSRPRGAAHIGYSESAVDATDLHATAEGGADSEAVPEPSTVVAAVPAQLPDAAVEDSRSVWSAAADGGTAIGRKSKEAGVATAGFFTRFARRVAGSFLEASHAHPSRQSKRRVFRHRRDHPAVAVRPCRGDTGAPWDTAAR